MTVRSRHESLPCSDDLAALTFWSAPIAGMVVSLRAGQAPTFRAANAALCALTGRRADDFELIAPSVVVPGFEELVATLAAGEADRVETSCVHANGRSTPVTLRLGMLPGTPPADDHEAPATLAFVQLYESVGHRQIERALRESEQRVQEVVDNVSALIYIKHSNGRFLLINRYFEEMFGVSREDAPKRTNYDFFEPAIAAHYSANDRRVLESGVAMEFEEPRADGGAWLSLKFPLFDEDGRLYAVGGVSTDISNRSRAEAAVRQAKEEAERANHAKSQFLSRMSHELRTPLNAILGFGQLLQLEELGGTAAPSVERIVTAGRHLLSLINEVLDLSRIESGAPTTSIEPVHAVDPLIEALELVAPLARERDIEIVKDFHEGLYRVVLADRQRLNQVLLNVISNGLKYGRPGGRVHVSFAAVGARRLRFRISDTGPGLHPHDIERIFVAFERLDASNTGIEGTGLGLSLSRSLVEAMGGTIGVEKTVLGEGTTFFVELELTDERPDVTQLELSTINAVRTLPSGLETGTIAYIEDNLSNLDLVQQLLAHVGNIKLIPAMQGRLGIELAVRHRPDLILLDLHLPDLDGSEVLEWLKRDQRTREIPVIVLSADATAAQIDRLLRSGASAYLTKPLDVPAFFDAIREALKGTK
ncbi:MAG: two-component system sensor protein [Solirubrobacterales bacterium]|jgi:PAS domain S-box-containing protein|nr:two-component system sensor protein [Solirubrobacterales bacterium]